MANGATRQFKTLTRALILVFEIGFGFSNQSRMFLTGSNHNVNLAPEETSGDGYIFGLPLDVYIIVGIKNGSAERLVEGEKILNLLISNLYSFEN